MKNHPTIPTARGHRSSDTANQSLEISDLQNTLNSMVDQMNDFAAEVNRTAREVGMTGPLAKRSQAPAMAGAWKDLTGNVSLMAANLAHRKPAAFKIFVVHEDTLTGVRAAAVLGRLADYLNNEPVIQNEIWKFESLAHPALYEQASQQAVDADMIIVSAAGSQALPSHVADLLSDALGQKKNRPSAVVALLDLNLCGTGESTLCARLREMAAEAGVDFFCNTGESYWAADGEYGGPSLVANGILNYS